MQSAKRGEARRDGVHIERDEQNPRDLELPIAFAHSNARRWPPSSWSLWKAARELTRKTRMLRKSAALSARMWAPARLASLILKKNRRRFPGPAARFLKISEAKMRPEAVVNTVSRRIFMYLLAGKPQNLLQAVHVDRGLPLGGELNGLDDLRAFDPVVEVRGGRLVVCY